MYYGNFCGHLSCVRTDSYYHFLSAVNKLNQLLEQGVFTYGNKQETIVLDH